MDIYEQVTGLVLFVAVSAVLITLLFGGVFVLATMLIHRYKEECEKYKENKK